MSAPARTLNKALTLLVYGESKAGKSLLGVSGRAPRLLIDCESAAQFLPIREVIWDPKDPPPDADGTWDTAVVVCDHWQSAVDAMKWLHGGKHPFKSVCLDSVSELQYKYVASLGEQIKIQDWGKVLRVIRNFCNQLRDMTKHPFFPVETVVVTSMAKQDDTGVWRPFLQGQMRDVIPYLFDVNGFLELSETVRDGNWVEVRRLYTARDATAASKFVAGSRISGRIPNPLELDYVTGTTIAEIGENNANVRKIWNAAYRLSNTVMPQQVAKPAPKAVPVTQGDK